MRNIRLTICLLFVSTALVAQFNNPFSSGRDRIVTALNWNTWLNSSDTSLELQALSRGFNVHYTADLLLAEGSNFSISPGLGISTNNIFHESTISANDSAGTVFTPIPDSISFTKNKLSATYAELPIEFRFRSTPNEKGNSVKVGVGIKGGLLLSSKTKYRGDGAVFGQQTDDAKIKTYKIPNILQFRYGPTFRFGYGNINLVAFYALSELFEANLGPTLNHLSIGLALTLM